MQPVRASSMECSQHLYLGCTIYPVKSVTSGFSSVLYTYVGVNIHLHLLIIPLILLTNITVFIQTKNQVAVGLKS